ncbi:peptidyl serine alpha-galactosyltransferase isoform X2 [Setaria italica]|nr:peptidyl serine alpha-galactosyltransferase isoform X2 [Setaria italica]
MSSLSSSSELPRRRQPPARLRRRNAADANQLKIDTPATSTAQPGVPLRPAPAAPRLLRSPPSRPPPPSAGEPPEPPSRPGEHRKSAAEPWHGKERTKVEGRNKNKLQLEKGDSFDRRLHLELYRRSYCSEDYHVAISRGSTCIKTSH